MANEIFLTDGVVRVTALNATQPMYQAIDVSRFDQADLVLHVHGIEGTATTFVISVMGAMHKEGEDGWVALQPFAGVTTSNGTAVLNVPRLLRYLRWKVTAYTGAAAVSFSIRGMARNNW